MDSIFSYTDYRLFLKAFYRDQKRRNRNFSFRAFGQRAGVSHSMLKDVADGRRNLSIKVMHKFATAMKLNSRETRYFELLVLFTHSKSNSEKNVAFAEMVRLRGQEGIRFIGQEHYEFFSQWYHSAIRELVTLPTFEEDYTTIAKRLEPAITTAEARNSIELMLSIGILSRDSEGRLVQSDGIISSEYEMASATLRGFHTQMICNAQRAIEEIPRELREISSLTAGLSQKMVQRLKERIRIFKEELITMINDDTSESETVCQINFQLFPLIKDTAQTEGENNEK